MRMGAQTKPSSLPAKEERKREIAVLYKVPLRRGIHTALCIQKTKKDPQKALSQALQSPYPPTVERSHIYGALEVSS
jgi:hypothetical protein